MKLLFILGLFSFSFNSMNAVDETTNAITIEMTECHDLVKDLLFPQLKRPGHGECADKHWQQLNDAVGNYLTDQSDYNMYVLVHNHMNTLSAYHRCGNTTSTCEEFMPVYDQLMACFAKDKERYWWFDALQNSYEYVKRACEEE